MAKIWGNPMPMFKGLIYTTVLSDLFKLTILTPKGNLLLYNRTDYKICLYYDYRPLIYYRRDCIRLTAGHLKVANSIDRIRIVN